MKGDLKIHVDESILGVKEYECTVISNKNVATFIKERLSKLSGSRNIGFGFLLGDILLWFSGRSSKDSR